MFDIYLKKSTIAANRKNKMTNLTNKIQELEKELDKLDGENGDLGAYLDYSKVLRETLNLVKQSRDAEDKEELIKKLEDRINEHENACLRKLQNIKSEFEGNGCEGTRVDHYGGKEKLLHIQLGDFPEPYKVAVLTEITEKYNGVRVEIDDGKDRIYYLTTYTEKSIGGNGIEWYHPGICERRVPEGEYTIKATIDDETQTKKVTVNSDTNIYLKFKVPIDPDARGIKPKELTKQNFNEEVLNSNCLVVVNFYAPWCGVCANLDPVFDEFNLTFGKNLKFAKVPVDDCPKLASDYQVEAIPSLIFYYQGREVDRAVGFESKDKLEDKIDGVFARNFDA